RADAVALAEGLREAHHPRRRGRSDADLLVAALAHLSDPGRGMEKERAAEVHRRLLALVEDPDLRAVADPDDVALDADLVAGAELQDLLGISDGEGDLVRRRHPTVPSLCTSAPAKRRTESRLPVEVDGA